MSGVSVYYFSEKASDKEALKASNRENASSVGSNFFVKPAPQANIDTVIDNLYKSSSQEVSQKFASILQDEIVKSTGANNRGIKHANFDVLKNLQIPALLIELGYITNKLELKMLSDNIHKKKIIGAFVEGIKLMSKA